MKTKYEKMDIQPIAVSADMAEFKPLMERYVELMKGQVSASTLRAPTTLGLLLVEGLEHTIKMLEAAR